MVVGEVSYAADDLMSRALAEDAGVVLVTADDKLLRTLEDTDYARLAHPLSGLEALIG